MGGETEPALSTCTTFVGPRSRGESNSNVGWIRVACDFVFVFFPEESGIPPPRLAPPVGLALEAAREKLAPEEPPEKRAVLMGPMDPPRLGAPPSFLPRSKAPLRGEEGFVREGLG